VNLSIRETPLSIVGAAPSLHLGRQPERPQPLTWYASTRKADEFRVLAYTEAAACPQAAA